MEEIPLDDVPRNADGSFTITRPGWYTLGGRRIAKVASNPELRPIVLTQKRELPKDEPIGNPEKWVTMNRAQRRAAKRGRLKT